MSDPAITGPVMRRLNPPLVRRRRPQILDPSDIDDFIRPLPLPDLELPPQPVPEPGSFSGGFSGASALIVVTPPLQPNLPGSAPQLREIATVDLKRALRDAWNDWIQPLAAPEFEDAIESICSKDLPAGVRRLYDAQVDIGRVAGADALNLTVRPGGRRFDLYYLIDAEHQMRFKADVRVLSDPWVTVDFHLAMVLTFVTGQRPAPFRPPATSKCQEGPPPEVEPVNVNGSVWLRSAHVQLVDPRVTVSKNDLLSEFIDFFRVGTFAQSIERRLAGSSTDLMAASPILVVDLRNALRQAQQQKHSTDDITPWYDADTHRLQLRLRQPSPFDVGPTDDVLEQ